MTSDTGNVLTREQLDALWQRHERTERRQSRHRAASALAFRVVLSVMKALPEPKTREVLSSDGSEVVRSDRLGHDALWELLNGRRVCAIHIQGFCSAESAQRLDRMALEERELWTLTGGLETDMFYSGGSVPIEVARRSKRDFFRYVGEQPQFVARQRAASGGDWPPDRLLEEFRRVWPHGATSGSFAGHPARPAIMRLMLPSYGPKAPEAGHAHIDGPPPVRGAAVCSANIYLGMPKTGGALRVWSVNLRHLKGWRQRMLGAYAQAALGSFDLGLQERIQKHLPKPHVIHPEVGDLILIHAGRPHAVAPVSAGHRSTLQSFFGIESASDRINMRA